MTYQKNSNSAVIHEAVVARDLDRIRSVLRNWRALTIALIRVLGNDEVGSGLGLSIVKTISGRIGASMSLGSIGNSSSAGLRVIMQFNISRS